MLCTRHSCCTPRAPVAPPPAHVALAGGGHKGCDGLAELVGRTGRLNQVADLSCRQSRGRGRVCRAADFPPLAACRGDDEVVFHQRLRFGSGEAQRALTGRGAQAEHAAVRLQAADCLNQVRQVRSRQGDEHRVVGTHRERFEGLDGVGLRSDVGGHRIGEPFDDCRIGQQQNTGRLTHGSRLNRAAISCGVSTPATLAGGGVRSDT